MNRYRKEDYVRRQWLIRPVSHPDHDLELTGREAVSDRAQLGRPQPTSGWHSIGLAMKRYEPTITMFARDRWNERQLWASAIGGGGVPLDLTASMVLAIVDIGGLHAIKPMRRGEHPVDFIREPLWIDGHRTDTGRQYDAAMPGLNVLDWKYGLARTFHRRYARVHG